MAKKVKKTSKKEASSTKSSAKKTRTKSAVGRKTTEKKTAAKKRTVKKDSVKKTVGKKKAVRRRKKSTLTAAEIAHFRELLMKKRAQIVGDVNIIENGALKKSRLDAAGDLSSMPIHMADIGTDNFEQEFALELMGSERKLLEEIYEALKRIDNGVYGICEGTGEPIAKARLEAKPWARYCIEYAKMIESGQVKRQEEVFEEEGFEGDFEEINVEEDQDSEDDFEAI